MDVLLRCHLDFIEYNYFQLRQANDNLVLLLLNTCTQKSRTLHKLCLLLCVCLRKGIVASNILPNVADICASIQYMILHHIAKRVQRALIYCDVKQLMPLDNKATLVSLFSSLLLLCLLLSYFLFLFYLLV